MQKFRSLLLVSGFLPVVLSAQSNGLGFAFPLDRNPLVTGNYAELRPNHFHAGLDFSTDPTANLPIRCVADGYVSRIKISSGGYGRVLYVTHPNGYVTVYAHQKKYADKVNVYTRQQQRAQQKNEIELFPKPGELPVKKGEVIGYTGNSGSSTGPHLHFEVRNEKTEIPINPLLLYDIKDDVKPVISQVAVYNTADSNAVSFQRTAVYNPKQNALNLPGNTFVLPQNTFALAFSGYDQMNGSANRNNIYDAKIELDGKLIYHHQLDNISFDQARYVNVFSEKRGAVKYQKCFAPLCYDIGIYKTLLNGGKIELPDTLRHVVELTAIDEKGNTTSLVFYVKAQAVKGYAKAGSGINAFCNSDFNLELNTVRLFIPKGALASNASVYPLKADKFIPANGVDIGSKQEKLLKPFDLRLWIGKAPVGSESKMVMLVNGDAMPATYENGWLHAEPKALGHFAYAVDSLPPIVTYGYSKTKPATLKGYQRLVFKVSDALSGIGEYHLYINDTWQIAEYDAKSSAIFYEVDEETPSGALEIRLEVSDKVGNRTTFSWKTQR